VEILIFVGGTIFGLLLGLVTGYALAISKLDTARQDGFMSAFANFAEMAQKASEEQKVKTPNFTSNKKNN
jgi:hypothetical protein